MATKTILNIDLDNVFNCGNIQMGNEIQIAHLGITNHMTTRKEWFKSFFEVPFGHMKVHIVNDIVLEVTRLDNIDILLFVNNKIFQEILVIIMKK